MPYIRELLGIWHLEVFINVTDSLSGSCCINSQWPWGPLRVDPPPRNLCERCWAPIPHPVVLQPPPEGRQLDKEEMTRLEQREPHQERQCLKAAKGQRALGRGGSGGTTCPRAK